MRSFLCAETSEEYLAVQGFGLPAAAIEPVQDNVWRLRTAEGDYALKRSELAEPRLRFILDCQQRLRANGCTAFALPCAAADDRLFCTLPGGLYTLNDWVQGARCDFDDSEHLQACARTLAQFHLRARGMLPEDAPGGRFAYFDHPQKLSQRTAELARFYRLAERQSGLFARLYRAAYPVLLPKAERARRELLCSDYARLAAESYAVGQFIHYDVAARNFLIGAGGAYLIDFDYAALDLPVVDLLRLIKRALKRPGDDAARLAAVWRGYASVRPLDRAELTVLIALLRFPQKYWRLAKRWFDAEKDWDKALFERKLAAAIAEIEREQQWLPLLERYSEERP